MSRGGVKAPGSSCDCGQRQILYRLLRQWRILFFSISFWTFVTLPETEARASDVSQTQRLINNGEVQKIHGNDPRTNYIMDDWQHDNLYVGRSGDPWGSPSIKQRKSNLYMHVTLPTNSTSNETQVNRLSTYEEKSLRHARFKRGVVHLYNMVVCATGCNPLAYKGYGCYCGFLGSGYVIDGIDRCCKMHDWCYDATDCAMFSEYFVPYYWRCYNGHKPVCAVEHGGLGGSGSCAQRLCECDRSLAECLRRYPCPTTKAVCTSSAWRLVQNLFMII